MNLSILLPAYEEAENLKALLPEIQCVVSKLGISFEILVVDTVSPKDDTKIVCERYGVRYISRRPGDDYGDAIRTGIKEACGQYIVTLDADGSHEPKSIPALYDKIEESKLDIVIGSRYCKGGDTHNGFILRSMSLILNTAYRLLFGLKIKDVSNSFRIYQADKLKKINLECNNFDVVEEILIRMKYKYPDLKVEEIPISFQERQHGESKRNLIRFIFSYCITIMRLMRIKMQEKSKGAGNRA